MRTAPARGWKLSNSKGSPWLGTQPPSWLAFRWVGDAAGPSARVKNWLATPCIKRPKCGEAIDLCEKGASSRRVMRKRQVHGVDNGIALWQVLRDVRNEKK
jgi:hypothetical protein